MAVPEEIKNTVVIGSCIPISGYVSRENCHSKRYMLPSVECSTDYNGQDSGSNLNVHQSMNGYRCGAYTHTAECCSVYSIFSILNRNLEFLLILCETKEILGADY